MVWSCQSSCLFSQVFELFFAFEHLENKGAGAFEDPNHFHQYQKSRRIIHAQNIQGQKKGEAG